MCSAVPPSSASMTSRVTPTQSALMALFSLPRTSGCPDQLVSVNTVPFAPSPRSARSWSLTTTGSRMSWTIPWVREVGFLPPNTAELNQGLRSRMEVCAMWSVTSSMAAAASRTDCSMAAVTRSE